MFIGARRLLCPRLLGAFLALYDWTGTELVLVDSSWLPPFLISRRNHKAEARQEVLEEGLSVG